MVGRLVPSHPSSKFPVLLSGLLVVLLPHGSWAIAAPWLARVLSYVASMSPWRLGYVHAVVDPRAVHARPPGRV